MRRRRRRSRARPRNELAEHKEMKMAAHTTSDGTPPDIDRLRTIASLERKRRELFETEGRLRLQLRGASSTDRGLLMHAISQIILELDRVEARLTQIENSHPFRVLPGTQDQALLDAIQRVGAAADGTRGVAAVVEAALNLVD